MYKYFVSLFLIVSCVGALPKAATAAEDETILHQKGELKGFDRCMRPYDRGVTYSCSDDPNAPQRQCKEFEPNGVIITRECNQYHEEFQRVFNVTVKSTQVAQCANGRWEGDLNCVKTGCEEIRAGSGLVPWLVNIYQREPNGEIDNVCGGVILTNVYVMTGANCFTKGSPGSRYLVVPGELVEKFDDSNKAITREVSEVVPMQYNPPAGKTKVALAVLDRPVKFDKSVHARCLDEALRWY